MCRANCHASAPQQETVVQYTDDLFGLKHPLRLCPEHLDDLREYLRSWGHDVLDLMALPGQLVAKWLGMVEA